MKCSACGDAIPDDASAMRVPDGQLFCLAPVCGDSGIAAAITFYQDRRRSA